MARPQTKSQAETDIEILASAKIANVTTPESTSQIRIRNIRSVHPTQCFCLLHRNLNLKKFNPQKEIEDKADLGWYQEESIPSGPRPPSSE